MNDRGISLPRRLMRAVGLSLLMASCAGQIALARLDPDGAQVHVRCAEHGELTHVAAAAFAPASLDSTPVVVSGRPGAASGHDHCPFSALLRHTPTAKTVRPSIAMVEHDRSRCLVARPAWPVQRPLLAWAPKTSPPATAV